MTYYATNELVIMIIGIIICVGIFMLGNFIFNKTYNSLMEFSSAGAMVISGVIGGVLFIFTLIFIIGSANQRNNEEINYQENLTLQQTLQQAIDNSEDMVNTDLYLKAIDFNSDLAAVQTAQADPKYSPSFSGDVDWTTIPFINIE